MKTTTFKVYGNTFTVDAKYEYLGPLGKGSYGIVCAAKNSITQEKVAIKRISPMARHTADAKHTLREIRIMKCLGKHPNIITLKDLMLPTNKGQDELYAVMDLMDTDLHRVIQSSQSLTDSHFRYFLHQLLRGVKYLHDNRILHRDLKPGNLLVSKNCVLKIGDFGLARKIPDGNFKDDFSINPNCKGQPMTEHVVTRWYRPPELMLQPDGFYTSAVDIWSIGCIFAELLGRKPFFPGKNFVHQLTLIFDVIGTPSASETIRIKSTQAQRFLRSLGKKRRVSLQTLFPSACHDAIDLLEKMLQFNPSDRCTVEDALNHPYMQSLEKRYKGSPPEVKGGLDFDFDMQKVSKSTLKQLIIQEAECFGRVDTSYKEPNSARKETVKKSVELVIESSVDENKKRIVSLAQSIQNPKAENSQNVFMASRISNSSSQARKTSNNNIENISMRGYPAQKYDASESTIGSNSVKKNSRNRPRPSSASANFARGRIRPSMKPPVPKQGLTRKSSKDNVETEEGRENDDEAIVSSGKVGPNGTKIESHRFTNTTIKEVDCTGNNTSTNSRVVSGINDLKSTSSDSSTAEIPLNNGPELLPTSIKKIKNSLAKINSKKQQSSWLEPSTEYSMENTVDANPGKLHHVLHELNPEVTSTASSSHANYNIPDSPTTVLKSPKAIMKNERNSSPCSSGSSCGTEGKNPPIEDEKLFAAVPANLSKVRANVMKKVSSQRKRPVSASYAGRRSNSGKFSEKHSEMSSRRLPVRRSSVSELRNEEAREEQDEIGRTSILSMCQTRRRKSYTDAASLSRENSALNASNNRNSTECNFSVTSNNNQRSTTCLNAQKADMALKDDGERSKRKKKVTVPVSPKFSVMSWQKKHHIPRSRGYPFR